MSVLRRSPAGSVGGLSGRRGVLLLSRAGPLLSWLIFAGGYSGEGAAAIGLIALSRVVDGVTGGNASVAATYLVDVTTKEERVRVYAGQGAIVGGTLLIGPAIVVLIYADRLRLGAFSGRLGTRLPLSLDIYPRRFLRVSWVSVRGRGWRLSLGCHVDHCARRGPSTQNSLRSGSAKTTQETSPCPMSTREAPSPSSRSTSAPWSSGRRSM